MKDEHVTEGERFVKIAILTNNYTPPADACNTYKVTFSMLQEFEQDLHKHIHLENNILFPKAIEMQSKFII
jgi:regulator of cell morphogenesis and NO signaling